MRLCYGYSDDIDVFNSADSLYDAAHTCIGWSAYYTSAAAIRDAYRYWGLHVAYDCDYACLKECL